MDIVNSSVDWEYRVHRHCKIHFSPVFLDFKTDGFNVFVCKFDDKGLH